MILRLTSTVASGPTGTDRRPTGTFRNLLAQWAMSNVAYWGVMAIVSLYLLVTLRLPSVLAATTLLVVTLLSRLSRLLAMPVMGRLSGRASLRLGLALGLLGNLGLALVSWRPAVVVFLALVGIGYSTTALAIKTIVAALPVGARLMRYASINLYLNVGAASGPILTNALFLHWRPRGAFLLGALAYAAAMALSRRLPPVSMGGEGSGSLRRDLRAALARPSLWRAILLNALGFFLYSQLYATLPLYVRSVLRMPDLLGLLLAVNGSVAVVIQIPLVRLASGWRLGPQRLVMVAFAGYAIGFAALWLTSSWLVCAGAVLVWTVGETLVFPSVDAMFADSGQVGSELVAFTVAGLSAALGESLGSFTGVSLAGWLDATGSLSRLYALFMLGAVGSVVAAGFVSPARVREAAP
jgi:Na+/melibiose symporter-like transporter